MAIKRADADRGAATERLFQSWLDKCALPYIYVEQSPISVPKKLRHGAIKRPDYIIALPTIGTVCCDVKSKSIYNDKFIFDDVERRSLANFQIFFNMTVYFCVFPTDCKSHCYLLLNSDLMECQNVKAINGKPCVEVRLKDCLKIDFNKQSFKQALLEFIDLA